MTDPVPFSVSDDHLPNLCSWRALRACPGPPEAAPLKGGGGTPAATLRGAPPTLGSLFVDGAQPGAVEMCGEPAVSCEPRAAEYFNPAGTSLPAQLREERRRRVRHGCRRQRSERQPTGNGAGARGQSRRAQAAGPESRQGPVGAPARDPDDPPGLLAPGDPET